MPVEFVIKTESLTKIFNKKTSFYITVIFFTFIANYTEIIWIDHLIGYSFFIPFFIYYFENIRIKNSLGKIILLQAFSDLS